MIGLALGPYSVPAQPAPRIEGRGAWVTYQTQRSPSAVGESVAVAKSTGLNLLLVQARHRGDAYYWSSLAPRAESLAEQAPSYDPLRLALTEAHDADLEVHAWINAFIAWSAPQPAMDSAHVLRAHPEWFCRTAEGFDLARCNAAELGSVGVDARFLSPGIPAVRAHLVGVVRELVERYPVDGIHLDYVRYPGEAFGFHPVAVERFAAATDADSWIRTPGELGDALSMPDVRARWEEWRAEQVTAFVREVREALADASSDTKLSAAVMPDALLARRHYGQDWARWLAEGLLDFVVPMVYTDNPVTAFHQVSRTVDIADGGLVYAGLPAYKLSSDELVRRVTMLRPLGVAGFCLFSYDSMVMQPGYFAALAEGLFGAPAEQPTSPGSGQRHRRR